jgi:hypothetical protein
MIHIIASSYKMKRNEKNAKNGKNNCAVFAKMEILTIYFGKDENVMPICLMK